ncbi:MAG TPA: leucine--tRNA ligase [Chitinivibrionales bacterium]|nr:leucine--tRNA ligase [Chitinivibrionales bacterium]
MSEYKPNEIEQKWQARWREAKLHKTEFDPARPKYYALDMFPYPSGSGLHVGHCEGYTATDIITRFKRMQGFNVLHPMGWDAFGLPAENFAIKTGIHPRITTEKSIANFRRQIDSVGFCYDWDREVNTTDPAYYKWTQWIFLQLFKKGLAYEGVMPINWCPSCKTGLANEEVKAGLCERCGTQVERKALRQWLLRITQYADRLLSDLDEVDWPESTLLMQKNWIGRSEGAEVVFRVTGGAADGEELRVFTTRPDTLYGATYMVLSPEHALVDALTAPECKAAVRAYQAAARRKSDLERTELTKEKTGVFTGGYAINPVNENRTPVWIADYVLSTYGTGAIMAVPAHDERDFEFATVYKLPIIEVVCPENGESTLPKAAYVGEGVNVNSGDLNGLPTAQAKEKITVLLAARGLGKKAITYRLRDWLFSRQRYWGEPMPLVHCDKCGTVAVPEAQLPVLLPEVDKYEPSGTGDSPLATIPAWVNTTCPSCGGPAKRETNTMPQWAGSCWYYLRYLDAHNDAEPWTKLHDKEWMNVDLYVGGAEHAVLHLLYARFWHKVLFDLGYVSTKEPFKKLRHQGTVLARTFSDAAQKYHEFSEIEFRGEDAILRSTGEKLSTVVEKMAKSKLNGINPDDVIRQYGADTLRLYEMFMGDFELPKPWDPRAIEGCNRFLRRVFRLVDEFDEAKAPSGDPHLRLRHRTIKQVHADLDRMQFNTAVARLMEFLNELSAKGATREDLDVMLRLMAPYAPHFCDEAWEMLGNKGFVLNQKWPDYDEALTKEDAVTVVVQVNGKLRGEFSAPVNSTQEILKETAMSVEKVKPHIEGKSVKKVIVVAGKLVNIVVG